MQSSESIKELATALAKAQAVMENASRDKDNPFFKSKYADLESVVGVVRPALQQFGLSFVQVCHDWDVGAKVETIIIHESGEWLSCGTMTIPTVKADAQGFMSALTYCRRGSLSAAFGVATEDDDGQGTRKKESFKSESKSEWDKLDQETRDWMLNEAMSVAVMIGDGDIVGAYHHIESLALDDTFKTAFWSRLDPTQRSSIKACASLIHANSEPALIKAWGSVPKHAQAALMNLKDQRKAGLQGEA